MKLYATTTSERASKGQGGNNHLKIDLNVGSTTKSRHIATITLIALQNGGYELFYYNIDDDKKAVCLQTGEIKGKSQKGESFMSTHRRFCDETPECQCDCECHN